ncbi:MAG: DUF4256 family protein [Gottschalkiaceae bacterium]|nr:MAG: DUF4256 family protein [Gottschalkiaceae bacterium]
MKGRGVCLQKYDCEALVSRKGHKHKDSAIDMATAMGVEILSEEVYRKLQDLDELDLKTRI